MDAAHQLCPYSRATRGNIPVTLEVVAGASGASADASGQNAE
jgi:hypothetical protein